MKRLILTFMLLFSVAFITNAQTVGSTKSEVLEKNGVPDSIVGTDVYMYLMKKGVVLSFQFRKNKVEMMSAHRKRNPEQHKAIYDNVVSQRGKPTTEQVKNNTLYSVWKYKNYNYVVTYNAERQVSGIIVTKSTKAVLGI